MNAPVTKERPALPERERKFFTSESHWRWISYALAFVLTMAALQLRLAITSWAGDRPMLILFILPIIVSAYFGGLGPGLVSTGVAALGAAYLLVQPMHGFGFSRPIDIAQWLILIAAGVLLSILGESWREDRRELPLDTELGDLHSSKRKIQGGFALALICLGVVGIVSYLGVGGLRDDALAAERTTQVVSLLESTQGAVTDAETGVRGFVVTGEASFLDQLRPASSRIDGSMKKLLSLEADDVVQVERLQRLSTLVTERLQECQKVIGLMKSAGFEAAREAIRSGRGEGLHDQIREIVAQMEEHEREVGAAREDRAAGRVISTRRVIIFGSIFAFVAVALAVFITGRDFAGRTKAEGLLHRQAALMDQTHDAVLAWEWDGTIIYWNRGAERLYGFEKREAMGRVNAELLRAECKLSMEAVLGALERDGLWEGVLDHWTRDGRKISVESRCVLLREGDQTYVLESNRDISKRLSVEAALREANEQLEARVHERTLELELAHIALRESENRLRTVTDTARVGLIIINEDHRYQYVNRAYAEIVDCPPEKIVGRHMSDVIPGLYEGQVRQKLIRAFQGERVSYEYHAPSLATDGKMRYYAVAYEPKEDQTGKIVVIAISDITEQKRSEVALRESEELFSVAFRSSPAGIAIYRQSDSLNIEVNDSYLRLFQCRREEVFGKTARQPGLVDEKSLAYISERFIANGGVFHEEIETQTRDGRSLHLDLSVQMIRLRGEPCILSITNDITARKKADQEREKLMQLIEHSEDFIATADLDGRITFMNRGARKMIGMPDGLELGELTYADYIAPEWQDFLENTVSATALERGLWEGEMQLRHMQTGADVDVHRSTFLLRNAAGEPVSFATVTRDITAQKRAAKAVRESEERLQAVTENLSEGLIVSNPEGQLLHWNRAGLQMHGFGSIEEGLRALPELAATFVVSELEGEEVPLEQWPLNRILRGEVLRDLEVRLHRNDSGWQRILSYSGSIVQDASGKPLAYLTFRDITEKKQAEKALRASEERLRMITNLVPHGIFAKDAAGRHIFANLALAKECGLSIEEMIGKTDFDLVADPAQAQAYHEADLEVIKTGQPVFIEEEAVTHLDGRTRYLQTTKMPFTVPETGEPAVLGVWVDITARKAAEEALRRSESTLAEAEKLSGIGSFDWDLITDTIVWSRNMYRLLDIDTALKGAAMNDHFMAHMLHPDDRARMAERVQAVLTGAEATEIEYRIIRRNGEIRNIHAKSELLRLPDGRPRKLYGWIQDVTEKKKAEAALRSSEIFNREVLDSLTAHIAVLDHDGTVVVVNDAWRRFGESNGRNRETCYVGENYFRICEQAAKMDQTVAAILAGIRQVMAGEREYFGLEYPCFQKNEQRWFRLHVCPLTARSKAVVTAHEDITERRRAEEEIRQLNLELEQRVSERTAQLETANKELEAFSYSVSHDLRSPLRAIDGFSQALLEDFGTHLPKEGQGYLGTIRQGAQRMGNLIDDLLTFSRLSRSRVGRRRVETTSLVKTVLEELLLPTPARKIEIRHAELPECWGDPALLKQVWINLLSNALKYTLKQPASIVEIGSREENGETVFFVRDNGTGFDMRYAGKLFGVFQRLHRVEDYEGTGVGLAIVQRIVHRHGGRVWAQAALGQGATFSFTLAKEDPS